MVLVLLWSLGGLVLCSGMAFVADRVATDLFRSQEALGQVKR